MNKNVINNLTVRIVTDEPDVRVYLLDCLDGVDRFYSYIVYKKPNGLQMDLMVSQTAYYNTITKWQIIEEVQDMLDDNCNRTGMVAGYRQPPLDILCHCMEPLVYKLAQRQQHYWRHMEFEDLCQICRLCMVRLYHKGYFVHKRLLERAFINEVLQYVRREKCRPVIMSFDALSTMADSDGLTLLDVIPDQQLLNEEIDEDAAEQVKERIEYERILVQEQIGVRQYDQLLREYGTKTTTNWARKLVFDLKELLK